MAGAMPALQAGPAGQLGAMAGRAAKAASPARWAERPSHPGSVQARQASQPGTVPAGIAGQASWHRSAQNGPPIFSVYNKMVPQILPKTSGCCLPLRGRSSRIVPKHDTIPKHCKLLHILNHPQSFLINLNRIVPNRS